MLNRVKLYTDTEFNSGGGKLLSAALVSSQGHRWYKALEVDVVIDFWPAKHVLPVMGIKQEPREKVLASLETFLRQFDEVTLVVDNNTDANHFAKLFEETLGNVLIRFEFVRPLQGIKHTSKVPHNALSDAHALMEAVLGSTVPDEHGVTPRSVYEQLEQRGVGLNRINSDYDVMSVSAVGDEAVVRVFPVREHNRRTRDRWSDGYDHALGNILVTVPVA